MGISMSFLFFYLLPSADEPDSASKNSFVYLLYKKLLSIQLYSCSVLGSIRRKAIRDMTSVK